MSDDLDNANARIADLSDELAELRAENERLRRERDEARQDCEVKASCARTYAANYEQADARAEQAEAACVALRDKLRATAHQVAVLNQVHRDAFLMGSLAEIDESICKLLASPDPGAGVRAVVEAAERWDSQHPFDDDSLCQKTELDLKKAVRARRGKERG